MHSRLLASALALAGGLLSQTPPVYLTQPGGGGIRSISAAGERVLAANGQKAFEVRDNALIEVAAPASIVAASVAIASVKTASGDTDIRITALDGGKSITVGGRGNDVATRAVTARDGSVYVLGNTGSADFPVTNSSRARGALDGFLMKFDAGLNTVYSTYLGGAADDDFQDLAVDLSGSAFVAASSNSAELAPGLHGSGAYLGVAGGSFDSVGAESFRATVQAWLAPNENTLFAATAGQGLFRSADQGQTWTPLNQGLGELNLTALAGDAQTLYAGSTRALYRSTNGGASWSESAVSSSGSGIRALAAVPRDRNIVYAALRTGCGLYRSADAGRTWQTQLASDVCVAALAVDNNSLYAFSADGGVFQAATTGAAVPRRAGTLANPVAVALDGTTLYAATAEGVSKSTDNGVSWIDLFRATGVTALSSTNGRIRIGTADQGVLASDDGGATFVRVDEAAIRQPVRSIIASAGFVAAGTDYLPDVYVAKVGPRGDQIVFSAFFGGLGSETSARVALDTAGNIVIGGTTDSADLVATFEAVQRRHAGGGTDLFLAKLNSNFELAALTYLGGSGREALGGIAIDSRNFVYIAATTASPDLPASPNASRAGLNGGASAPFLAALSPNLGSLAHLTYGSTATGDAIAIAGNDIWIGGRSGDDDGYIARFSGLVSFGAITSVRNGASLAAGPIAPMSTVLIDGSGFGSSLFGLTVRMGTSEASVVRASDTRIVATAPPDLEPGSTVPITVTSRTGLFQGSASVAAISPGVFAANGDGKGVALASVLRIDTDDVTTITPVYECADEGACVAAPVDLGDEGDQLFLLIRATGVRNGREVAVEMNGTQAEVVSSGALDAFSGVDQIVVKLPRSIAGPVGQVREVTIRVTVDGQAANPVTMLVG